MAYLGMFDLDGGDVYCPPCFREIPASEREGDQWHEFNDSIADVSIYERCCECDAYLRLDDDAVTIRAAVARIEHVYGVNVFEDALDESSVPDGTRIDMRRVGKAVKALIRVTSVDVRQMALGEY